ncbi:MAG: hypothetical protein GY765_13890 [bacterium]|nr:hypothetical protein [bacterium]
MKKKLEKRFSLNKTTVVNLGNPAMENANGGGIQENTRYVTCTTFTVGVTVCTPCMYTYPVLSCRDICPIPHEPATTP